MQKNIKNIIAMILFFFTVVALPVITRAEEQKPPEIKPEQKLIEEDKVTGEVDLSVLSAYIWRGYEQTRNSVVIEPAATLSYKGFSINVWGNLDTKPYSIDNSSYGGKYTETDYTLSYSKKFGILQVTPGYIYYALGAPYAGGTAPQDSQEVFLSLGLDTILSPTLSVYKEIDHYRQWYFLLGLSHTFELSKKVGLKLAASASYLLSTDETTYAKYDSDSNPTADKFNNFHDGTFTVCLPIAITRSLTITPTASYVFPLSDDARYEMKAFSKKGTAASDRDSSYLYGGVTLSFTF
ncbi:MAG: hypothetical protein ABFD50_17805 [Smithella sp.]